MFEIPDVKVPSKRKTSSRNKSENTVSNRHRLQNVEVCGLLHISCGAIRSRVKFTSVCLCNSS